MPLLRLDNISLSYGTQVLVDGVELILEAGHKVGLLGRNGAGKTSLLKLISGNQDPDSGERWLRPGTRIGLLDQLLPPTSPQSVYDFVADGLPEVGELLKRYHQITQADDTDLQHLERVQSELEANNGWMLAAARGNRDKPARVTCRYRHGRAIGWMAPACRVGACAGF